MKEEKNDDFNGLYNALINKDGSGLKGHVRLDPPIILNGKMIYPVKEIVSWEYRDDCEILESDNLKRRLGVELFYYPDKKKYYICYHDHVIGKFKETWRFHPTLYYISKSIRDYGGYMDEEFRTFQRFILYLNYFKRVRVIQRCNYFLKKGDKKKAREQFRNLGFIPIRQNSRPLSKDYVRNHIHTNMVRFFHSLKDKSFPTSGSCDSCNSLIIKGDWDGLSGEDQFFQHFQICSICKENLKPILIRAGIYQSREKDHDYYDDLFEDDLYFDADMILGTHEEMKCPKCDQDVKIHYYKSKCTQCGYELTYKDFINKDEMDFLKEKQEGKINNDP